MKRYISLLAVLLAFVGCVNPVDDYYTGLNSESDVIPTQSILEYLSSDSDYEYFVELLTESGVIDTLDKDYLFTVFAPTATQLKAAGVGEMSVDSMALYMKMHICANPKTTYTLANTTRLSMFSDKYLAVTCDSLTMEYSVDGVLITDADIRCTDGIIHKVEDVIIPRLTIYEWLLTLGDDYSIFRDELVMRTIYTFDRENSVQIGETELGRPIYDSVFIASNDILDEGDISDEEAQFRFVIPSNDVILQTFSDMADSYVVRNMPVTEADSTEWMEWYLKASIYDYSETGYESFDDIEGEADYSVFDLEFRPATVTMSEPLRLSNGFAYTISKGHLPAYIPMETVVMNAGTIRYYYYVISNGSGAVGGTTSTFSTARVYTDNYGWDYWSSYLNYWQTSAQDGVYCQISYSLDDFYSNAGYSYSWKTCKRDDDAWTMSAWNVVPGNYALYAQQLSNQLYQVADVYVNGDFIDRLYDIDLGTYEQAGGVQIGPDYFYIGDSLNTVTFKVHIGDPTSAEWYYPPLEPLSGIDEGSYSNLKVGDYTLVPVNNY